jgi:adenine-specific DNA-methyltransferase
MEKGKRSRSKIERVAREAPSLTDEQVANLKGLFPESVTEGKVDFDKLRTTLGDEVDGRAERYSFSWAGKRDCIRLLQTPSRATLIPAREESVDFDTTQNLFIEGDNLEVLKLLYKSYFGRVKMIYIDPPYNIGTDKIYEDDYSDSLAPYLRLTGQADDAGNVLTSNPETSGRFHSAWLSMMYPRLFVARQLLREDGVILISIDDNEVHNLRMVMNEIFGEENFVESVVWKKRYGAGGGTKGFAKLHEYVIAYSRNQIENIEAPLSEEQIADYKGRDEKYATRGGFVTQPLATSSKGERSNLMYPIMHKGRKILPKPGSRWLWSKDKFDEAYANNEIVINEGEDGFSVRFKQYLKDESGRIRNGKPLSIKSDIFNQDGTKEVAELFGGRGVFEFPKPSALLRHFFSFIVNDREETDGVYLDFFAGSGTSADAIMDLNHADGGNRRFIMVQLPEPTGRKDFPTIADIGKERIRRVITKMKRERQGKLDLSQRATPEDLGFKVFKLTTSNYRQFEEKPAGETDSKKYAKQMAMFRDALVEGWKPENVIYEVAIKEGFGLNCRIEEANRQEAKDAKKKQVGPKVYRVTDPDKEQSFYICLDDEIRLESLRFLNLKKDDLFICRDKALDDEAAANLALQCRLKTT